jgi:hypothetical protein
MMRPPPECQALRKADAVIEEALESLAQQEVSAVLCGLRQQRKQDIPMFLGHMVGSEQLERVGDVAGWRQPWRSICSRWSARCEQRWTPFTTSCGHGNSRTRSSAAGEDIWTGSRSSHQGIEEHYGRRGEEDRSAIARKGFAICGQNAGKEFRGSTLSS